MPIWVLYDVYMILFVLVGVNRILILMEIEWMHNGYMI